MVTSISDICFTSGSASAFAWIAILVRVRIEAVKAFIISMRDILRSCLGGGWAGSDGQISISCYFIGGVNVNTVVVVNLDSVNMDFWLLGTHFPGKL